MRDADRTVKPRSFWRTAVLVISFGTIFLPASAQNDPDKIPVSIDVSNLKLSEVIELIREKSGVAFSYNPKKIPVTRPITYSAVNKSLSEVVREISQLAGIGFEFVEQQIILQPLKKKTEAEELITVSGFVKDQANGEALIGATVMAIGQPFGTATNAFGFYSLTLPKGAYTLSYTYLGFEAQTSNLTSSVTSDILLHEQAPVLNEVIVNEGSENPVENVTVSKTHFRARTVEERPALFGETDVIKSLESVPGVKLNSDGSTFYYVRGGARDQNLVLLDDAPIYNPSHMLGLFSTIIPDAVNDINFYKGGAPASLGGRISSILDVRTKKGNDQRPEVWGSVGLIATKLGVEGPLKKGKSSFLVSARASRLKWFFHLLNQNVSEFNFYDVTAKANFTLSRSNRVFVSFYTGQDKYYINNAGIAWQNTAGTLRWNHVMSEKLFVNTTLAVSSYDYSLYTNLFTKTRWTSHISNVELKSDFSYFVRPDNEITFGAGITGYNFNPGNFESPAGSPFAPVSARNSGAFVLYGNHELKLHNRWGLNYGLRLTNWINSGPSFEIVYDQNRTPVDTLHYEKGQNYSHFLNAEPRITLRFTITEKSSLKANFARNAQNIHLISNSVSPFTSLEVWLPSSVNIRPQTANQFSLGYYRTLGASGITLEAETFYKKMFHQIDYLPHANTFLNPLLESQLAFGTAVAYGAEVIAKKDEGRLRGLAGYSYSRAKRTFADINDGKTFNAFADRPHQITLMLAYQASLRWNIGVNWNYSTGSPYTSPVSFFRYNDQEVPVYGQKNNDRLPDYHRMDFSATYKLNRNPEKRFTHSVTFSVFNLYGRKNVLFVNYNKSQDPNGDIVVPSNLAEASRLTTNYYLFQFTPSLSYNFKWL